MENNGNSSTDPEMRAIIAIMLKNPLFIITTESPTEKSCPVNGSEWSTVFCLKVFEIKNVFYKTI